MTDGSLMQTFVNWCVIAGTIVNALPWLASRVTSALRILHDAAIERGKDERIALG